MIENSTNLLYYVDSNILAAKKAVHSVNCWFTSLA